ncbi:hypothetical protein [Chengkuizengella axinellae]|uniref:DUF5671 domain-containing protein n=1 Tax=Chengkuizengella axinellae TaxID=3064388 RepID=A0ABT9J3G6_9BACL|nr:hypothetical protein [Chengkuizengella sp. 2205SS18-9]MDP5276166.1 hypothetical protein [Chengkuizengella sp. 2205SS18-9]
MNEFVNDTVSIYLPLLGIAIVVIRTITSVINKTVAEIILTPINKRSWEQFLEMIFICSTLIIFIHIPNYSLDNPIYKFIDRTISPIIVLIVLITTLFLVIVYIVSIFSSIHSKLKKTTNIILVFNGLSVLVFTMLVSPITKNDFLLKYINNNLNTEIFLYLLVWIVAYYILLTVYRNIFLYFNKINPKVYKILKIPDEETEKILAELYFVYTIDQERHILKEYPHSNRTKGSFPLYVYYPKENKLIKFTDADKVI